MKTICTCLLILALVLVLGVTGCGKKAKVTIEPGPPMATQGFGAIAGTCAVCGVKSTNLLSVTSSDGVYTAQVCGKDCGDKFRANPAQYGKTK